MRLLMQCISGELVYSTKPDRGGGLGHGHARMTVSRRDIACFAGVGELAKDKGKERSVV